MAEVSWQAVLRECPLCAGQGWELVGLRGGSAHRRRVGVETAVVRCTTCDLRYCRPTLLPQGNPYQSEVPDEYFTHLDEEPTFKQGLRLAAKAEGLLGAPGRMLEVGCGLGIYLLAAKSRGWAVRGIDFTQSFVARAQSRGLDVECADPLAARSLDERYDCIVLMNILEHLYEPRLVLRRVAAALRPGGVVVIGVPNEGGLTSRVGNAYFRLTGRAWSMNLSPTFPPFHVVGFTPRSMKFALRDSGLATVSLETVRGFNDMEAPTSLRARAESMGISGAQRLAKSIGMGDAMEVWARRPSQ